jgi:hypothetical protein
MYYGSTSYPTNSQYPYGYTGYQTVVYYPPTTTLYTNYATTTDPEKRSIRRGFDLKKNKTAVHSVPPVLLSFCTSEPFPKPLVVRWATKEWRARRLAAGRVRRPIRSRPGRSRMTAWDRRLSASG